MDNLLVSIVFSSSPLIAGDLTEIARLLALESGGVGGSFFTVIVLERLSKLVVVVLERTGRGGCAFLTVMVLDESRFDMDFCLTGERGDGPFGSSFTFVTHHPPAFFSCIFRGSILRESIFPIVMFNIPFSTSNSQLLTAHASHSNLVFLPCPPVLASLYLRHDFLHFVKSGLGQITHKPLSHFMPVFLRSEFKRIWFSRVIRLDDYTSHTPPVQCNLP